jgi:tryptophan 2,3-dioxygenase
MVNSFRSEIVQKKAIFGLLSDDTVTQGFPAHERKAIRDHIPWTRVVAQAKTSYDSKQVDLPEFILGNREKLVLRPNDVGNDMHSFRGWETDPAAWERALKTALRAPYVVQERVTQSRMQFPIYQFGRLDMKEMQVDVHPQMMLGKVEGCAAWVAEAGSSFSTLNGVAPTLVIEGGA